MELCSEHRCLHAVGHHDEGMAAVVLPLEIGLALEDDDALLAREVGREAQS